MDILVSGEISVWFFKYPGFFYFMDPLLVIYPWTARRSNQSILKVISPEYSLEGLMLKLKLQYFGDLLQRADLGKDPDAGKD